MRLPLALRPSVSLLLLASLQLGCPGDDPPAESEGASSGSSGTAGPEPTTSGPVPDGTTTDTPDPDTTSTTDPGLDSTGSDGTDGSTGDPPATGTCVGFDQAGTIDTVASRDGTSIPVTCDPAPIPCGGDLVATWNIETSCGYEAFPNPLKMDCPGSSTTISLVSQTGTLTFENDGTFVQDLTTEVQIDFSLDSMTCFGIDCGTFEFFLQMDSPSATCQAMGPTCNCTILDPPENAVTMGTYQVVGQQVVFMVDADVQATDFCVAGDRLDLWSPLYGLPQPTEIECSEDEECFAELSGTYDVAVCVPNEEPM